MTDNAGVTHRKVDDIFILELPARDGPYLRSRFRTALPIAKPR